jgi:hypothetical protein
MPLYFALALITAVLLISLGVALAIAIGRVIRRRDTQIPREDDQS